MGGGEWGRGARMMGTAAGRAKPRNPSWRVWVDNTCTQERGREGEETDTVEDKEDRQGTDNKMGLGGRKETWEIEGLRARASVSL